MAGDRSKSVLRTKPMVGCIKTLLCIFNLLFLITGIAILALGIWTKVELYKYMELTSSYRPEIPYVLIATGCGILIFGTFGCIFTFKPNPCLLYSYAAFLFIIFIIELSAGIAGLVLKGKLEESYKEGLHEAMKQYATNGSLKEAVDKLQETLGCCGENSSLDWNSTSWGRANPGLVPKSCCKVKNDGCNQLNSTQIYSQGCFKKVTDFTKDNLGAIGGAVIGFSFIQLFGALFAYLLGKATAKYQYEQVA